MKKIEVLSEKNKICSSKNIVICFAVVFCIQMLYLNLLHPLYADDWFYSVIWDYGNTFHSQKISSLSDVITSQYAHYLGWGGRVVAHSIAQFFIMLNPLIFDIVNTLVFIVFLGLIYKITNKGQKHNVYLFVFIMIAMWIGQPVFPSTTIWLTGSCNYLWCTLIVLLFLYPYCKLYGDKGEKQKRNIIYTILFFLFGIIAGWTNENISVSAIFFIVCLILLLRTTKIAIPDWAYSGLIGAIIGCAFLLLAPGNSARSELMGAEQGEAGLSILEIVEERLSTLWTMYLNYVLPLTILLLALIAYRYFVMKQKKDKSFYTIPILFFLAAHVAFFAMIATPVFPPRATFGLNTFLIIAIGILYANIDLKYKVLKIANFAVVLLAFSYYIYSYSIIYERLTEMNRVWTAREELIKESKEKGVYDILFDDLYLSHKRLDVYDLNADSTKWENRSFSTFYEIHSVRRISKDDYKLNLYPQE